MCFFGLSCRGQRRIVDPEQSIESSSMSYYGPYYQPARVDVGIHSVLFTLTGMLSVAELGMMAWFADTSLDHSAWPSTDFERRIKRETIYLLFVSCWTVLGAVGFWTQLLFADAFWTFICWVMWLVGAILITNTNHADPLSCQGLVQAAYCKVRVAAEAVAWTEMVLLILVFFSGLFTIHARRDQMGGYNNAFWSGYYGGPRRSGW